MRNAIQRIVTIGAINQKSTPHKQKNFRIHHPKVFVYLYEYFNKTGDFPAAFLFHFLC